MYFAKPETFISEKNILKRRHIHFHMDRTDSHIIATTSNMTSIEARDRLHAIMTSDMAEAIEQIGQTLEACNAKKARLLNQLDEVSRAVEAVRNECGCIDTTIA